MKDSSPAPQRAMKTREAARYLGISVSLLRKMRSRAPDDPQGQGPTFIRIGPALVLYECAELNRWLDSFSAKPASHTS